MTKKQLFINFGLPIIIAAALVAFGVLLSKAPQQPSTSAPSEILDIRTRDHTKGSETAKVVLIEYADFQCPGCAAVNSQINQLLADFPNDLKMVYRHFPLKSIHKNAVAAAMAAEAAGVQGKFFEMTDLLYANQSVWSGLADPNPIFLNLAGQLQIDQIRFRNSLNDSGLNRNVETDYSEASDALGLNSTPTFFLNGKKIANPSTYSQFKDLINDELK